MKDYRLPQVASVSSIAIRVRVLAQTNGIGCLWSVPDIEGDMGRPLIGNRNRMI
jgi:hypothetical protein